MTTKRDPYEFTTVRRLKDVEKLIKKGWELVESSGKENWVFGSDYKALLRRSNPKFKG